MRTPRVVGEALSGVGKAGIWGMWAQDGQAALTCLSSWEWERLGPKRPAQGQGWGLAQPHCRALTCIACDMVRMSCRT